MSIPNKPDPANMLVTIACLRRFSNEMRQAVRVRGKIELPPEFIEQTLGSMNDAIELLEQAEYWLRPVGPEPQYIPVVVVPRPGESREEAFKRVMKSSKSA